MIIAVNTRLLLNDKIEGIGRFSYEILKRITVKHSEHTFIFFFDRPFDKRFVFSDNVIPVVLSPPARHPFLWYWYFEFSVTRALKKYKADLFITPDGWLSLKTNVKTLQVLHDLHYEKHPEHLPFWVRKYYCYFFPRFARKAARLVTVSDFCKKEIMNTYGISDDKIDIVYNSTRDSYHALNQNEIAEIRKKYTGGNPYFLFIGPFHPRKNPHTVIQAFLKFRENYKEDVKLIITGSSMWKRFGTLDKQFYKDVLFTGYLDEGELFKVTAAAKCLIYVSFYEGFGIPVLEAMSCDVPIITSNISAMPEIAGGAALLADPYSVDSVYNAMYKIYTEDAFAKELVQKGRQNLSRFSWDRSAILFWESILKTI